jgi:hypothetical protein
MNVNGGAVWGRGKERILRGEEDGSTLYICMHTNIYIHIRQHNEPNLTLKGGKKERKNGNTVEGVNLFKVHCAYMELSQ